MTAVPATRTLPAVLRRQLGGQSGVRLLLATTGTPLSGGDGNAYVNVVIEGATVKVPRLAGSVVPAAGRPAYLLASADFLLYLGTVSTTN